MAKKPVVKEAVIERALRQRVEALSGICLKIAVLGRRGFFDRLIVLPHGRVVFCELKKPRGGRLSVQQTQYLAKFTLLEVEACIIKTKADIDRLLAPPKK